MDEKKLKIPKLPSLIEFLGWWVLFLTITAMVVISLVVQGGGWKSIVGNCLVQCFPWVLAVSVLSSAGCTTAAAKAFGTRYTTIEEKLESLSKEASKARGVRVGSKGFEILQRSGSDPNAGDKENRTHELQSTTDLYRVFTKGTYTPHPYHRFDLIEFSWSIEDYLKLLADERHAARAATGKLAGALGGASAAGILAFGRLVKFLEPVVAAAS